MAGPNALLVVDVVVTRPGAGAAEVLLVRRGRPPFAGRWALPGGKVRPDEDVADAARRELAEETGIVVTGVEYRTVVTTPGRDPRGRTVSVVFRAAAPATATAVAATDAADARWFPVPALLGPPGGNGSPPLAFDHRGIIESVLGSGGRG